MNKYDNWHTLHTIEDDINSSWHEFAKTNLNRLKVDGKTILEIACGRGGFTNYLTKTFPNINRIYACDYSKSAVSIGENKYENFQNKIFWQVEDIQQTTFETSSIDIIISCETVEHIPSLSKAIKELSRVIKPGGKMILTCPNYFNLFGIWCVYRLLIGKPYTEGGQPFVRYILSPWVIFNLKRNGFKILHFHSSELIIPSRRPIHFFNKKLPWLFSIFGYRTFYVLEKK